jgi:hypothetical protein
MAIEHTPFIDDFPSYKPSFIDFTGDVPSFNGGKTMVFPSFMEDFP